jgi:hypothetical protein
VRILLERYNPYFARLELGFRSKRLASFYRHVYNLPPAELDGIVYQFDTDGLGIGPERSRQMRDAIKTWRRRYHGSSLTNTQTPDGH